MAAKPKKIIKDEVSLAWEVLKKKTKREKNDKEEKKEEAKENEKEEEPLEESVTPKERTEFFSILPEKAPSLESSKASQDLESSVGRAPKETEEEKEMVSYFSRQGYTKANPEEIERKYERLEFVDDIKASRNAVFEKADITQFTTKGRHMQFENLPSGQSEFVSSMEYGTRPKNEEEKMEFGFERKEKKYKPIKVH